MDNKCIRVLHVVSSMNRGGAETMIMNIYRNIDKNKLQFDFVCHIEEKCDFEEEINKLGGRIIRIKSLGTIGFFKYVNEIKRVIDEYGPFRAIHAHTDIQAGIVTLAAKQAQIPIRICHSHNTKWKENPSVKDNIQSYVLRKLAKLTATDYCACGNDAASFFYGEKFLNNGKVKILNNGIDIKRFLNPNKKCIEQIQEELNIKDKLIVGHIGRFYEQKNHKYIIDIAIKLKKETSNFLILLLGKGPLEEEISEKIYKNSLQNNVIMLGVREEIPEILSLLDVFIFPSFFEGLPVTLIETQAAGIRAIISDTITNEVDMKLGLIERLSLSENIDAWVNSITRERKINITKENRYEMITKNGYNAKKNIEDIYFLYNIFE